MRLVILNPHVNYCGKMVFNWLFRLPHHHKYNFLWQENIQAPGRKVVFLVDGTQSSFFQTQYFTKTVARIAPLLKVFSILEFWIWLKLNNISRSQCSVVYSVGKLDPGHDIIFAFGATSTRSTIDKYTGLVLLHLTHYHHGTQAIASLFSRLRQGFLIAENDLTSNDYFRRYFPNVKKVYSLPLTITSTRFRRIKDFRSRINKCFASGSMSVPTDASYVNFYGSGQALNPMREIIYQNKGGLGDAIDAYIFPHNEALKALKEISPNDRVLKRFAKRHFSAWLLKLLFKYQLPFFSFDIVEKYNGYTMFMSPEERTGLPSMKLLEGMLCGSVLVGIDDPMYTNIGFEDGKNYIAYRESDLEDLVRKIAYYQERPAELEHIAENGYVFAKTRFSAERVASVFWQDLERLLASFRQGGPQFHSSFLLHKQEIHNQSA